MNSIVYKIENHFYLEAKAKARFTVERFDKKTWVVRDEYSSGIHACKGSFKRKKDAEKKCTELRAEFWENLTNYFKPLEINGNLIAEIVKVNFSPEEFKVILHNGKLEPSDFNQFEDWLKKVNGFLYWNKRLNEESCDHCVRKMKKELSDALYKLERIA